MPLLSITGAWLRLRKCLVVALKALSMRALVRLLMRSFLSHSAKQAGLPSTSRHGAWARRSNPAAYGAGLACSMPYSGTWHSAAAPS